MIRLATFALAAALASASAHAVIPVRDAELPPPPNLRTPPPTNFWSGNTRFPSYVIQVSTGAVECPRRWYEPGACRDYVPGRDRRPRAFVRKIGDTWMVCPNAQGQAGCGALRAMPNLLEQD